MKKIRDEIGRKLARFITAVAAVLALTFALVLPAALLLSGRTAMRATMEAEAKLAAEEISRLASLNPELWRFAHVRMRGLLSLGASEAEWRGLFDREGALLADYGVPPGAPARSVQASVYDSGLAVGHVEIRRSERDLLLSTCLLGLLTSLVGIAAFTMMRVLPLRMLSNALVRAAHLAAHDVLTGLPNRTLFQDRLEQALSRARREGAGLAVLCVDLDRFKDVNDTLGHGAGDRLLREVSARLASCIGETDTLARLGGDEFAVVQGGHQPASAEALARHLLAAFGELFRLDGTLVSVGISIGVTVRYGGPADGAPDAGTLMKEADLALNRAKAEGRGTFCFFVAEMNEQLVRRRALEADLRNALRHGELSLHYQPQIDLLHGRVVGAEALLRWHHPVRGSISPAEFIPLAEETGLILPIGDWVLQEACRQAAAWPGLGHIAVNVSPAQFRRPGFVEQVRYALEGAALAPERLELEVTEGVLLTDTEETLATLRRLRVMGVTLAMDDFGTGYSSLGYLNRFRFDKIKIDRSFVRGLGHDERSMAIVRAVLGMSLSLGIRVNAEGIEEEGQAALLRAEGCSEVQGYLFGRPMPPAAFARLLERNEAQVAASD